MRLQQEEQGAAFWRELVACPRCREPLPDMARCVRCGANFGSDDGTARLMIPELSREYTLPFSGRSWEEATRVLERVAHDPGGERTRDLPYHVDPAHAAVLAGLVRGSAVLDIGCGGGQCRSWIRSMGHRYVGADLSKTRVHDWLREFGGPDVLCDAHFLPFKDESFDAVYCAALFEHLACPPLAMLEAFRVLRPGGLFCGNASFMEPWHDSSFFHLSPLGAVQLLVQAGFEPVHVWPSRGYSGFKGLTGMAYSPALQPLTRGVGVLLHALFSAQLAVGKLKRRMRRQAESDVLRRAVAAGATDWIARRPLTR